MANVDATADFAAAAKPALHIPDGFVSAPVAAVGWVAAGLITFAARRGAAGGPQPRGARDPADGRERRLHFRCADSQLPRRGRHLAAILLGPRAAIIVMTAVVALQTTQADPRPRAPSARDPPVCATASSMKSIARDCPAVVHVRHCSHRTSQRNSQRCPERGTLRTCNDLSL